MLLHQNQGNPYLQPDGCTVINEATVRVFGVVVTHLSERITHEDGSWLRTQRVEHRLCGHMAN